MRGCVANRLNVAGRRHGDGGGDDDDDEEVTGYSIELIATCDNNSKSEEDC